VFSVFPKLGRGVRKALRGSTKGKASSGTGAVAT